METLLGLRLEVDQLRLTPRIPAQWESCKIHYRYRETFYHITVSRTGAGTPAPLMQATLDGAPLVEEAREGTAEVAIPLVDDRRDHYVEVRLGGAGPAT